MPCRCRTARADVCRCQPSSAQVLLGEGVDPLVHLTGRNRNRIALESDLLGLGVAGVSSLLYAGRGIAYGVGPPTRQVFELSAYST